jgi:hypothetical protein
MVASMTARPALIKSIVDHVAVAGSRPVAIRAFRAWRQVDPSLGSWGESPAELAAAARRASPADRDSILSALLAEAAEDEWAQLTTLAILAPRLSWIVGSWARHPGARSELADLEAELLAECLQAIANPTSGPPPGRPGLALVDRAWSRVRDRRARERRRGAQVEPVSADHQPSIPSGDRRPGQVVLASAVTDAFTNGHITLGAARALYLTRVAGLSTRAAAAAMDTDRDSVRALRSRAARRLTAA